MTLKVKDAGGTLRTITSFWVKDGSTLRRALRLKVMDGATLRTAATFVEPLSAVTITPSPVTSEGFDNVQTTEEVTAAPSNGLGPYTYAWTVISESVTINSPSSAKTTFTSRTMTPGEVYSAVVRCTCTDSTGTAVSKDLTVAFHYQSLT
jgi:hypothetical protein